MKMSIGLRMVLITLGFLAFFAGVVILQYPQKQTVTITLGDCTIQGNIADDYSVNEILYVYINGIRLQFTAHTPLRYRNLSGKEFTALPKQIKKHEGGYAILFSNGASLAIEQKSVNSYVLAFEFPEPIGSASVDYRFVQGARLYVDARGTRYGTNNTFWSIEGAATLKGYLGWRSSNGKILPINITRVYSTGNESILDYLAQNSVSEDTWSQNVKYWQEQVFTGLRLGRFRPDTFQWKTADGAYEFNEKTFITYIAELLAHGKYEEAAAGIVRARSEFPGKLSWEASVFTGKTMPLNTVRFEKDDALVDEIRKVVLAGDESIFYRFDTIKLLIDTYSNNTLKAYLGLAKKITVKTTDISRLSALLGHYLDCAEYFPREENPFTYVPEQIDSVIPLIQKIDSFFYLEIKQGAEDVPTVLRFASLLIRYGELTKRSAYTAIGRTLILSILNFADSNGMLPAELKVENGRILPDTARLIAPETVYALFTLSPYYPRKIRYPQENGEFIRVYTAGAKFVLEKTDFGMQFSTSYPEGYSHYVIMEGIVPFERIQLYGINYNMDPEFEIYNASGYFYKRNERKLFVKMKHKKTQEDIRLFYSK